VPTIKNSHNNKRNYNTLENINNKNISRKWKNIYNCLSNCRAAMTTTVTTAAAIVISKKSIKSMSVSISNERNSNHIDNIF
jgi:hypothetical protein